MPARLETSPAISTDILDICARVLVILATRGLLIPDTALPVYSGDVPSSFPHSPPDAGACESHGQTRGQHSVVRRLRRLTGTFRRPPIGWPRRVLGAPRSRVTSGPPARRLQC